MDDAHRGRLRSILAELRPVELIKARGRLDPAAERALKDHTRQPLINDLAPEDEVKTASRSRSSDSSVLQLSKESIGSWQDCAFNRGEQQTLL